MHKSIRQLIFAIFALAFFVSAPLVVLYTAGYRLNISNRSLLQTGVLAVTTYPRGSSVLLNGLELAEKTPAVYQRVTPKDHDILIRKKGYHDWSQRIHVDEGKTTYVTARLFANSQPELLNPTAAALALRYKAAQTSANPDQASVALLDNGANTEVRLGQIDGQLVGLLPRGNYQILTEDDSYLLLVNEKSIVFVIARQGGDVVQLPVTLQKFDWLPTDHLLLWTDGTEVNVYDAESRNRIFITRDGHPVTDVAWHPDADSFLVANDESLSAYDLETYATRSVTQLVYKPNLNEIWLDSAGRNLYYTLIAKPGEIYRLQLSL
jgi:hypothetical protein